MSRRPAALHLAPPRDDDGPRLVRDVVLIVGIILAVIACSSCATAGKADRALDSANAFMDAKRPEMEAAVTKADQTLAWVREKQSAIDARIDGISRSVDDALERAEAAGAPVDDAGALLRWAIRNPGEAWSLGGTFLVALFGAITQWRGKKKAREALSAVTHAVEEAPQPARAAVKRAIAERYGGCEVVRNEVRAAKNRPAPRRIPDPVEVAA